MKIKRGAMVEIPIFSGYSYACWGLNEPSIHNEKEKGIFLEIRDPIIGVSLVEREKYKYCFAIYTTASKRISFFCEVQIRILSS